MATIPEDILMRIEEHRPDLAWLCGRIRTSRRPGSASEYERILAYRYLHGGDCQLTPEETVCLLGCIDGEGYGVQRAA